MSDSNSLYPRSKQEDTEQIVRQQWDFRGGMQPDKKPENLSEIAVYELNNMRASSQGLRGRHGTIPTSSNLLPHILSDLTDLSRNENVVTSTTAIFEDFMIGYKIGTEDNRAFFIEEVTDANNVIVTGEDVTGSEDFTNTFNNIRIRGAINAHFYDSSTFTEYYLIGKEVYTRTNFGSFEGPYYVHSNIKITSAFSSFYKVGKYVCLNNPHGIFVFNPPTESAYAWRANHQLPLFKPDKSDQFDPTFVDSSAYRVAYTYGRLKGSYLKNRLNSGVIVENETPPRTSAITDADEVSATPAYTADREFRDISTFYCADPILDTSGVLLKIANSTFSKAREWELLYEENKDPYVKIKYNNIWHICYFSFNGVKDIEDVRESLQSGLNRTVSPDVVVNTQKIESEDTVAFLIYSKSETSIIEFEETADTFGLDILRSDAGEDRPLTVEETGHYMGELIQYFRYPSDRYDVTHYPYYRSLDIKPYTEEIIDTTDPRYANFPDLLIWVDDIPVCKFFTMSVASGRATITDSNFSEHELNCSLVTTSGMYIKLVKDSPTATDYLITGDTVADSEEVGVYIGATHCINFIKTGNIATPVDYVGTPDEDDIGKIIFWQNGEYSMITGVSDGNFITLDTTDRTEYGLFEPTYREYNDTTSDILLRGRTSEQFFLLETRGFLNLPNNNIAVNYNNILLSGSFGSTDIYYGDSQELSLLGYYNGAFQRDSSLETGVTGIALVEGNFVIFNEDTNIIDPAQVRTGGDPNYGEAYSILPPPALVARGIGITNPSKIAYGLTQGIGVITNEPAVRTFNGISYSENLAEGTIQRTKLQKLDTLVLMGIDKKAGLYIWGKSL